MNIVLVSKCSFDIEQYVEFKMSVLISPSKSLISSRWVTYGFVGRSIRISSESLEKRKKRYVKGHDKSYV